MKWVSFLCSIARTMLSPSLGIKTNHTNLEAKSRSREYSSPTVPTTRLAKLRKISRSIYRSLQGPASPLYYVSVDLTWFSKTRLVLKDSPCPILLRFSPWWQCHGNVQAYRVFPCCSPHRGILFMKKYLLSISTLVLRRSTTFCFGPPALWCSSVLHRLSFASVLTLPGPTTQSKRPPHCISD